MRPAPEATADEGENEAKFHRFERGKHLSRNAEVGQRDFIDVMRAERVVMIWVLGRASAGIFYVGPSFGKIRPARVLSGYQVGE